jgi:Putative zinc-binding metallo-peptidase
MPSEQPGIHEAGLGSRRLRDLGLTIAGTPLEAVLREFQQELAARGVVKVQPHFYLSTEWGVPFDTISIAIPFYLARIDLTDFHAERGGFVEGGSRADVLRYLRHEMGHVVNYAYRLYERPEWKGRFGDIDTPYEEEYRPHPFSRRYVNHLPGYYAQKHPDEDWAETFAVWMTPGLNWRDRYAGWPALAKLEYCDQVMADLRGREPLVTAEDPDEDVGGLDLTLDEFYRAYALDRADAPADLDDALQTIFDGTSGSLAPQSAATLIRRLERIVAADVYRWTGWFPERVRHVLDDLAVRAEQRGLTYAEDREAAATVALTAFVTALAMSRIQGGDPGA